MPSSEAAESGASAPGEASNDNEFARPTDDEILVQQNIIRSEEAFKTPYVADLEPLSELKAEYSAGSEVFVRKIEKLESQYSHIRRTRGDGNCFFRGFIYSYLEGLLNSGDVSEVVRFSSCIRGWSKKLVDCNYQELVFEDAMDLLLEQVAAISKGQTGLTLDTLISNFRDDTISNMVVMFLRLITSCEIQRRQEFLYPFILGLIDDATMPIDVFCQRFVEAMGEESDHIHIVALTGALDIPIRVVYLDRSGAEHYEGHGSDVDFNYHDFVPDSVAGSKPRVHLLYRPGHYDILYPMDQQS